MTSTRRSCQWAPSNTPEVSSPTTTWRGGSATRPADYRPTSRTASRACSAPGASPHASRSRNTLLYSIQRTLSYMYIHAEEMYTLSLSVFIHVCIIINYAEETVCMVKSVVLVLQWLHEESLISPDSHYPWVGPQRSLLLTTIKKVRWEQASKRYMYYIIRE